MSETGKFDTTNILVVGTGGQGVMTATEILAEAAIALGHDVKKTEVAGMAQRGGVVSSHLRFGPKVLSPQITPGSADVLLGFEAAEAMRWRTFVCKPEPAVPGGENSVNQPRRVERENSVVPHPPASGHRYASHGLMTVTLAAS
jgi:Pyruvate/2-oxoacid:ferredoxin oxidoreductase gamma subunit